MLSDYLRGILLCAGEAPLLVASAAIRAITLMHIYIEINGAGE